MPYLGLGDAEVRGMGGGGNLSCRVKILSISIPLVPYLGLGKVEVRC